LELLRRHATGITIVLFLLTCVVLSVLPLPDWLRPVDALKEEAPITALVQSIFRRAESGPRQSDIAAADFAITDDTEAPVEVDDAPKPELEVLAPSERPPWKRPNRPKFDSLKDKLKLTVLPVDNFCVKPGSGEGGCERRALDRFFDRLHAAAEQRPGATVRMVHYGDSIIASDHITDVVRQRLQERFGSGGKGFLLITRYNARQRRLRTGDGTEGWRADHIAQGKLPDFYFSYAGASFTAEAAGEETVFKDIGASRKVSIYYLEQPQGGTFEVFADNTPLKTIDTNADAPRAAVAELELPQGTQTMRVRAGAKGIRLFGASLEAGVPGVILESLGVPGTSAEVWLYPDEDGFVRHLRHRDPALVVTMLGGNDARTIHQRRTTIEKVETATRDLVRRIKRAAPESDCLIVSPLDGVQATTGGAMKSKPEVRKVIDVQRKVAEEEGCGFWNLFGSMGGPGSLERWFKANLINPDLIHPRALGGDLLGELMSDALMNAYDEYVAQKGKVGVAVP
jgi:lysophospholipase L1-like esterase